MSANGLLIRTHPPVQNSQIWLFQAEVRPGRLPLKLSSGPLGRNVAQAYRWKGRRSTFQGCYWGPSGGVLVALGTPWPRIQVNDLRYGPRVRSRYTRRARLAGKPLRFRHTNGGGGGKTRTNGPELRSAADQTSAAHGANSQKYVVVDQLTLSRNLIYLKRKNLGRERPLFGQPGAR